MILVMKWGLCGMMLLSELIGQDIWTNMESERSRHPKKIRKISSGTPIYLLQFFRMNTKKKILITGGGSMLAYDFIRIQSEKYEIISVEKEECDITSFESIIQCISFYEPDILLNCAAYTAVDDAEDIGMKQCYDINTLGSYQLARATSAF